MKNNTNTTNTARIKVMSNTCVLAFLVVLLDACIKTETTPYREHVPLHPPAWIQGGWVGEQNPDLRFIFNYNDVIYHDGTTEMSFIHGIKDKPGFYEINNSSLTDSCTNTAYYLNYSDYRQVRYAYFFDLKQGGRLVVRLRANNMIISEDNYTR